MPAKRKNATAKRRKTGGAQQQKAQKKAWGLLRANKGGVSRKRVGGTRRTRRSVFSTPGWRKQLAQTRGVGSRHKAQFKAPNKIIRGKIGHKHGKRGGWLPIVGSILASMLLND